MVDMNSVSQEDFNEKMDRSIRYAILDGMKTDPKFKEQFKELLNKKEEPDKVGIWETLHEDLSQRRYIIGTSKVKTEWSSIPIEEISLSRELLKSLYKQLIELDKRTDLK